ncbi:hypothetical protein FOF48_31765 [Corallococcus sp. Z5C101001]|nr:hypothetical protein FOF48_31765 [Corallococcus sp. Z5C101001]
MGVAALRCGNEENGDAIGWGAAGDDGRGVGGGDGDGGAGGDGAVDVSGGDLGLEVHAGGDADAASDGVGGEGALRAVRGAPGGPGLRELRLPGDGPGLVSVEWERGPLHGDLE